MLEDLETRFHGSWMIREPVTDTNLEKPRLRSLLQHFFAVSVPRGKAGGASLELGGHAIISPRTGVGVQH
jgi:hypothetical protein